MREVKFRGKSKATGEWIYGYYVVLEEDTSELVECIWQLGAKRATPIEPKTCGQYTGLKDKNEIEIYEGDIVKAFNFLNENEESVLIVVKYNTKDCGYNIIDFLGISYEVIGNIYENHDLLEVQQ